MATIGRPPTNNPPRQPRSIHGLDDALYRQARALAVQQGVNVADIINAALSEYLGRYAGRVERMRRERVE